MNARMNAPTLDAPPLEQATFDDPITRQAQARIGRVLRGKWRIDRLLGIGGMAAVYAGQHRNGKRGAIKMLHIELSTEGEARKRFLHEGYMANHVGHPGAVSVLDDDVAEDGSVFLVMELLEGQSVATLAESRPQERLTLGETMWIAEQLLDVLVAAHAKGLVHRDLKPDNFFLTNDGVLKVLDFGIARVRETSDAARMTKTGTAMGTPAFMPPEQALGEWSRVDARSDLWAVGASMFALLTGQSVHDATTLNQLLLKAMTAPAPAIRSVLPWLPADAAEVVDRALAFEPNDRWPSASAMQRAVRDVLAALAARGERVGIPTAAPPDLGNARTVAAGGGELQTVVVPDAPPMTVRMPMPSEPQAVAVLDAPPTTVRMPTTPQLGIARTVQLPAQPTRGKPPVAALIGGAVLVLAIAGTGFMLLRRTTQPESPTPPASTTPPATDTMGETAKPPAQPAPTVSATAEPTAEVRPSAEPTVKATTSTSRHATSPRVGPPRASATASSTTKPTNKDLIMKEWK
jgi:hypothetical protein